MHALKFVTAILLIFLVGMSHITQANETAMPQQAVLVTGASSGIGKRIAETLAQRGVFVYAGARKERDLEVLNQQKNMQGVRLDVTMPEDINAAVEMIQQQGKHLHGIVNNAGVFAYAPMIEVSERDLAFQFNVNVYGPYRMSKAFAPLLIKNQGRIVNIGSIAGLRSNKMFGPYSMSKFAVEAMTEAMAAELAKFDMSVSVIEPGNFNSNIMQNMKKRQAELTHNADATLFADEYQSMQGFTKTDRSTHADPQPVADAVIDALFSAQPKLRYLVTPNDGEARYAVGSVIEKLVQINNDHRHTIADADLIAMLEAELKKANAHNASEDN
ncbi:short-chain dehydrogenase/reductase [Arenicella chitinivorans]|uniref:Short-chain dehydrogenase/reductase n=1 Tax=Arenicella chitinivorans TaxID=1329800 RepID=A0A918VJC5_9GAMM|nr:SDR family oxidoreductase [Arenicella chitinivorans]GHA03605.1 short-chain dehydrogenase/reductase [Arenicella chitinivorans]